MPRFSSVYDSSHQSMPLNSPALPSVRTGSSSEDFECKNEASREELRPNYVDETIEPGDWAIIESHLYDRGYEECVSIIAEAIAEHAHDASVDIGYYEHLRYLALRNESRPMTEDVAYQTRVAAFLIADWSIYATVRAATRPIKEDDEECETFRVYVIAAVWAGAGSCLDTFFANRYPHIALSGISLQIMVALSGKIWSLLPRNENRLLRTIVNPGPWRFKEQMLCSAGVGIAAKSPYVLYAITAQTNAEFFGFDQARYGYIVLMLLSTSLLGVGMAGILRVFLVYPIEAIWYHVLPGISLNRALIQKEFRESINGWKLTRSECFWAFAVASFIWYWVTNFLFTGLSYFDWIAWVKPNDVAVQALCGAHSGLALNIWPSFDWSNLDAHQGMIMPLWSQMNAIVGVAISFIAVVIVWFTNRSFTGYLPINSNSLFDNQGAKYDVSRILDANGNLEVEQYRQYSLPFFSAGALVGYGCNFMIYTAAASHSFLYHLPKIWRALKLLKSGIFKSNSILLQQKDRFSRAQHQHLEVPEWWFISVMVIAFVLSVVVVQVYKFTQTPVWTIVLAIGLAILLMVPLSLLYSLTGFQIDVNELCEIIIGLLLPGNANANMISKVYAVTFLNQTEHFVAAQKQAHYVSIPPRALFRLQILCCLTAVFVQSGIIYWMAHGGIPDMCSPTNPERFTCQGSRSFFNAGVAWGSIGTARIMGHVYQDLKWVFLIGAFVPVPLWLFRKYLDRHPNPRLGWTRSISELTIISGAKQWAPSSLMYTLPSWYMCVLSNWFLKRRWPKWWGKYLHVVWAALGVGLAYGALIMFFSTSYHHRINLRWWGNTVSGNNLDGHATAILIPIPAVGYFGPEPGSIP